MIQPIHYLGHASNDPARRQHRPVDHDHGQVQIARGRQFGLRTFAARIFGDDVGDVVLPQQGGIICFGKRPTRQDNGDIWQRQWILRRINKAQQVMVLRFCGEIGQGLFADGQKYPGCCVGQGGHGGGGVWHLGPAVARRGGPRLAFQRDQRCLQCRAGGDGIPADLGSKRMGGINDMGDVFGNHIINQPRHTAKPADPGGQGLRRRQIGAACVGIHRIHPGIGQSLGQTAGLGGAAKKKDAHGG